MTQYADNNFSPNEFVKRAEYERDKVTEIKKNIINEYEISEDEYLKIYSEESIIIGHHFKLMESTLQIAKRLDKELKNGIINSQ